MLFLDPRSRTSNDRQLALFGIALSKCRGMLDQLAYYEQASPKLRQPPTRHHPGWRISWTASVCPNKSIHSQIYFQFSGYPSLFVDRFLLLTEEDIWSAKSSKVCARFNPQYSRKSL